MAKQASVFNSAKKGRYNNFESFANQKFWNIFSKILGYTNEKFPERPWTQQLEKDSVVEIKENNLKTTKEINVEEILHSETPFAAVLMDGKKKYDCFFREIKVKKKVVVLDNEKYFFQLQITKCLWPSIKCVKKCVKIWPKFEKKWHFEKLYDCFLNTNLKGYSSDHEFSNYFFYTNWSKSKSLQNYFLFPKTISIFSHNLKSS